MFSITSKLYLWDDIDPCTKIYEIIVNSSKTQMIHKTLQKSSKKVKSLLNLLAEKHVKLEHVLLKNIEKN